MTQDPFWSDLRDEIQSQSVANHPICVGMVEGGLERETIAELCAQLKFTVLDGISALSLIVPQAPRHLKKELAENLFGELCGTPDEPSHWELALRAGAAAGYTEDDIDARPMMPETKIYPDTVTGYAMTGKWIEALSFVSLGIEDMFTEFCSLATRGLTMNYGYDEHTVFYFSVHVGADEHHAETGWEAAKTYATTDERKASVRRAALEGRNMWWNMYSAVYRHGEGKDAPTLRLDA